MKFFSILFAISAPLYAAERMADYPAALAKAKASNQDIAILFHGSDWSADGEKYAKVWKASSLPAAMGQRCVLLAIDKKNQMTPDEQAVDKLNSSCPVAPLCFPAVVVLDTQGRLVKSIESTSSLAAGGSPQQLLQKALELRVKRDELWKQAETLQGAAKAEKLAAGLDLLNVGLGPKREYKPILEMISTADPQDISGATTRYTFNSLGLIEETMGQASNKQFEAAESKLTAMLAKKLFPEQKQQILGARFGLYQRWPAKDDAACKAVLKQMAAIDSKSRLGRAAAHFADIVPKK